MNGVGNYFIDRYFFALKRIEKKISIYSKNHQNWTEEDLMPWKHRFVFHICAIYQIYFQQQQQTKTALKMFISNFAL